MWLFLILCVFVVVLLWCLFAAYERHEHSVSKYSQLIKNYQAFETGNTTNNLFIKYGGLQTVQAVVDAAVTNLVAEPTLQSVFAVVGQPGHRSGPQLKACLDLQVSALLSGPFAYPARTFTRGAIVDARSMKASHMNLQITTAQFNTFVNILAQTLIQSGVTQADVDALAPGLEAMVGDIVTVSDATTTTTSTASPSTTSTTASPSTTTTTTASPSTTTTTTTASPSTTTTTASPTTTTTASPSTTTTASPSTTTTSH